MREETVPVSNAQTKAIIAVFGGSDSQAIKFALQLGRVLAKKQSILLTGGAGPGDRAVKNSAITGVGTAPWIGVDRPEQTPENPTYYEKAGGFIIVSNLGHKRNYLEAALCDAAVGLTGDKGTTSEVVFALSLHRPVALVGTHWTKKWPILCNDEFSPMVAASNAMDTVGPVSARQPKLHALLNRSTICNGLESLLPTCYRHFGTEEEANPESVVEWLLTRLRSAENLQIGGELPDIDDHESIREPYKHWLRSRP